MLYERHKDHRILAPKIAAGAASIEAGREWLPIMNKHAYDVMVETGTRREILRYCISTGDRASFEMTLTILTTTKDLAQAMEIAECIRVNGIELQKQRAVEAVAMLKNPVLKKELLDVLRRK